MMRVLLVSPHFPPSNAADMQRVRLVLPHLREAGVRAEVLAVEAAQVAAPQDEWLADGLPADVPIHRVKALDLRWSKLPGLGTLTLRAIGALKRKGDSILGGGNFDLVYFSTTQFGVHGLGARWKQRFGVDFAMDYQDPWVNDYYRNNPAVVPPGGRLKYAVSDWLSRRDEPCVLRKCSGITSVSAAYPEELRKRYPWFKAPTTVLPFPGDVLDLLRVRESGVTQTIFDPGDGHQHWVYVGRGGADMARAVRGLFAALRQLGSDQPEVIRNLRLHFIGTSYAPKGKGVASLEPLAKEFGLEHQVREYPDRIPYSETLRCLLDASALFVPGSDDPGYTASKIYPYLLAQKPLLAIFHSESSVISLMRKVGGGVAVSFRDGNDEELGARIAQSAFEADGRLRSVPLDREAFEPHTAAAQARQLEVFFQMCRTRGKTEGA